MQVKERNEVQPEISEDTIKLLLQRLIDSPQGLTLLTRGGCCRHEHWQAFKARSDDASNPEYHDVGGDGESLRFSITLGTRRFTTAGVDDLMAWAKNAMKTNSGYGNPKMLFVQN